MEGVVAGLLLFCALGVALGFPGAFKSLRTRRLIENLPTAKTKAVFIGLVELKGTAECEVGAAIVASMSGKSCVYVATSVEEERLEKYRTKRNGRSVTRTRRVWRPIASNSQQTLFYLRDETGAVRVDPNGAKVEPELLLYQTLTRTQPEFYSWAGGVREAFNSCGRRRFREVGIPLHSSIYVLGRSRLRTDVVAAEIAADPEEPTFLIAQTEKSARNNQSFLETCYWAWAYLGCVVLTGFVAYALSESGEPNAALAILGGSAVFVAIWSAGVAVATANSLVDLRRRVDQAKANVDVELKRRSDLIPALASAAKCLARYEREWRAMLATLRKQRKIVRVDGAEAFVPSALAARLFAAREKYPELRSNQTFAYLQRQMADAEERVALAREYYNNIVENYETRRQTVPYCYVASFLKLPPAKFFEAKGFEAKTVAANLEKEV